jgi:hypothetical protein
MEHYEQDFDSRLDLGVVETPSVITNRTLQRLYAINYTLAVVHEELFDPVDVDARADLLLAAEDAFAGALALVSRLRSIAWYEKDEINPLDIETGNGKN